MGLKENLQSETVRQLALREPVTARPDTTIRTAIDLMREKKLGCVIVVDDARRPLGMFTERMLTATLASERTGLDDVLADHMSSGWPSVRQSDPIAKVLEALETRNIRFLCVLDEDGRLVGLTGQKGLMEYVAEHFPDQVMVQRIGGTPYTQAREGA